MEKQIEKQDVMDLLLKACPSYKCRWVEYIKDSGYDEGEGQLLYIDLGDFACHLVELYKESKVVEFPNVFDIVELLHINGDEFVKEAVTVGLLESMQNVSMNSDLEPNAFIKFLKPESLRWWNKLNDFWEKGILLSDDE